MRKLSQKRGFTLLEVTIVIGLVSMLFLALIGTYMQIKKILVSESAAAGNSQAAQFLANAFASDMQNLLFEKWNPRQIFLIKKEFRSGKRFDAAAFPATTLYANPYVMQSRAHMVSYFTEYDSTNDTFIVYRAEDIFIDAKNPFGGTPVPFLRGAETFQIQLSNNGRDWEDEWDYAIRRSLPRYVKVFISYKEGDKIKDYTVELRPPILWY